MLSMGSVMEVSVLWIQSSGKFSFSDFICETRKHAQRWVLWYFRRGWFVGLRSYRPLLNSIGRRFSEAGLRTVIALFCCCRKNTDSYRNCQRSKRRVVK
jgi:hypothetical protein